MAGKLVLTYFPGRGRAELSRLILAEAGIQYTDNRVGDISELKKSGILPFGQFPILEHNGVILAQSISIARYPARLAHPYGKTELDGAKIDMMVDGVSDFGSARYNAKTVRKKKNCNYP